MRLQINKLKHAYMPYSTETLQKYKKKNVMSGGR